MPELTAPAGQVLDCFQTALLRIEQGLATWKDIRDCARLDIGCLEHLMQEVQQGCMDICPPLDSTIPHSSSKNMPIRSQFISSLEDHKQNPSIVTGSSVDTFDPRGNDSGKVLLPPECHTASLLRTAPLTDLFTGSSVNRSPQRTDVLPPSETLTATSSPTALPPTGASTDPASPAVSLNDEVEDNTRDDNYPSPVSSTNLDWELSQDGSDDESSVDFGMTEDSERESFSSSESE